MGEVLRVIGDGGDVPDGDVPEGLSDKDLRELFRWLLLLRTFDERAVALQRQGRIGTYALYWGEEATQAGPLYACGEQDWVFPSYRQNAIGILRGVDPAIVLGWWRGYGGSHGFWDARQHRVAPICVPIGTQIGPTRCSRGFQNPCLPPYPRHHARTVAAGTPRRIPIAFCRYDG